MKRTLRRRRRLVAIALLVAELALIGALGCGQGESDGVRSGEPTLAAPTAPADPLVRLDADAVAAAGITSVEVSTTTLERTVRGFGRVLDPLPIVDAVAAVEAARAADAGAAAERARMEHLAEDAQNASLRELENARTVAARAHADLAMARARLASQVGPRLAGDPGLADLAARLADGRESLIRIDVPGDEHVPAPERGVTLTTYPPSEPRLEARYAGRAAVVDPTLPGYALLFLAKGNAPTAGTVVVADCPTAEPSRVGVTLPAAALVYDAGSPFVFVDRGAGAFEQRAVEGVAVIDRADGSLFVSKGLAKGERVVAVGAQQLLSTELLGDAAGGVE